MNEQDIFPSDQFDNNNDALADDKDQPDDLLDELEMLLLEKQTLIVTQQETGWRLDLFLVHHFPKYSRMLIRKAIQECQVTIDGRGGKTAYRLKSGQTVIFSLPEIIREAAQPENIALDILFEDEHLIVINKPANMVVHPSRGHWSGTLVSALAYHFQGSLSSLRGPARPGIVHRLDRDTSGAILVAKNDIVHAKLAELFQEKRIHKEYIAIAWGTTDLDSDFVDAPIAHHPRSREKMAIMPHDPDAKEAQTFVQVIERFRGITLFRALPRTGRTHQIRLHLAHLGCPILCDKLYGREHEISEGLLEGKLPSASILLSRQALHAYMLKFEHPVSRQLLNITAPMPDDLEVTLAKIRQYRL